MSKGRSKGAAHHEVSLPTKSAGGFALAAEWPVHEVLLSRGWEEHGAASTLLLARRSPKTGKVAAALLLIDLGCLGVKSAQVQVCKDVRD